MSRQGATVLDVERWKSYARQKCRTCDREYEVGIGVPCVGRGACPFCGTWAAEPLDATEEEAPPERLTPSSFPIDRAQPKR